MESYKVRGVFLHRGSYLKFCAILCSTVGKCIRENLISIALKCFAIQLFRSIAGMTWFYPSVYVCEFIGVSILTEMLDGALLFRRRDLSPPPSPPLFR